MKATPPKLSQESLEKAKSDFINQPNKNTTKTSYPWEAADVRDDVYKTFNIRLKESNYLKLKYIAEHSKDSMHSICLEHIEDTIQKKLSEIL